MRTGFWISSRVQADSTGARAARLLRRGRTSSFRLGAATSRIASADLSHPATKGIEERRCAPPNPWLIPPIVDPLQQDRFRKLLLEQRDRVTASIDGDDPAENQDLRDPEELATIIARTEVNDRIVEDDLHLVQKIDLALSRLEDGSYDQCANCGGEIPIERLLAKPSVSLCVPCQEAKDAERR